MLATVAPPAAKCRPRFARELETPELRLPPGKAIGAVLVVVRGRDGDLFILHQPNAQGLDPEHEGLECWLPPVVRLPPKFEFIGAWGGPDSIPAIEGVSQWPSGVEGLECDGEGNLWVFGYRQGDDAVLKFSPAGELMMQIGRRGVTGDDTSTCYLDRPTACYHDISTREVFVSDGYGDSAELEANAPEAPVLRKPFRMHELSTLVDQMLGTRTREQGLAKINTQ